MQSKTMLILISAGLLSACATSPKVTTVQPGDSGLGCPQITAELQKLDTAQKEVEDKKGVTGTNVASFLLWLPGLAYTYYDASEALGAINQRRSYMTKLYNENRCDQPQLPPQAQPQPVAPAPQTQPHTLQLPAGYRQ